jgi:hypothetical protein
MVRILERESRAADIVGPGTSATGQELERRERCTRCGTTRISLSAGKASRMA